MKKLIALVMALAMLATFAACGTTGENKGENNENKETTTENIGEDITNNLAGEDEETGEQEETQESTEDTTTANDIMDYTWGMIPADQMPNVIGGHYSNEFTGAPASYELSYEDELAAMLMIPENQIENVIDASTAVHLMNANSMTLGMVKLAEGTDMKAFADDVYKTISENQWMCGFPEKLVIAQIHEDYVFIAYGLTDLLDLFTQNLYDSWSNNEFYNEAIG